MNNYCNKNIHWSIFLWLKDGPWMYYWPIYPYIHSWMAKLFSPFFYYIVAVCLFWNVCSTISDAAQKMKFSVKDFFSKCEQIHSFLCALLFIGTAWKVSEYGVFSGPYFPVFELNTGKYRPKITRYLDTFHAMRALQESIIWYERKSIIFGWY